MILLNNDEIAERIKPLVNQYSIREVVLFGSYARGEADDKSDIDLMVDLAKPIGFIALGQLRDELTQALGVEVDLITKNQVLNAIQRGTRFSKHYQKDKKALYA